MKETSDSESRQARHEALLAEYAAMPRVSSHTLARQLLDLPDTSALILWGSYLVPVRFERNEDGNIEFFG